MNDKEQLTEISKKLSVLIALNLAVANPNATATENIERLVRFGLSSQEIADILNTSKGTVDVIKSRLKSKK